MAFDNNLKADTNLFSNSDIYVEINNLIYLASIDASNLDKEAIYYAHIYNDEDMQKYLPKVYTENPVMAKQLLKSFIHKMILKESIVLCIRLKDQNNTMGFIQFHSPLAQTEFNDWSVEFWLTDMMRHNYIMTMALYTAIGYLKQYNISTVKASVQKENQTAIRTLENVGFKMLDDVRSDDNLIYGIDCNNLL